MSKEKKEKAPKVKKIKNKQNNPYKNLAGVIIAFILSVGTYIGFIYAQRFLTADTILAPVIIAKIEIPVNTIITEENVSEYFATKNIDRDAIPTTAIKSFEAAYGLKVGHTIAKGEHLTEHCFTNTYTNQKEFDDPVEMTISTANIYDMVGGKVRAGDLVNICYYRVYATSDDNSKEVNTGTSTSKTSPYQNDKYDALVMLENVYVTNVYNSAGEEISTVDKKANASIIQFTIERDDALALSKAVANSNKLTVSRTIPVEK